MKENNLLAYLIIFVIMCFLVFIVYLFISNFNLAEPSVKAGLIGLISVSIGAIITNNLTKKREIIARQFANKRDGYMILIDLILDIFHSQKTNKEITKEEMINRMFQFRKNLMIWGNGEMINIWNDSFDSENKINDPKEMFNIIEKIIRIIRKDLGHDDKNIPFGQFVGLLLYNDAKKEFL